MIMSEMIFPMYLTESQIQEIELEVIPDDLKIYLTRILRKKIESSDNPLILKNKLINLSRTIRGETIYVLIADEDGCFQACDIAWHEGEFELIFRSLSTIEFIEYLGELIEYGFFDLDEINDLLEEANLSFRYKYKEIWESTEKSIEVIILTVEDNIEQEIKNSHPNIRVLIKRMEKLIEIEDFAGVLHTCATIFETLAKDIIRLPSINDQTLKSFFDRYRKDSKLPKSILDYILEIYDSRSKTPLAAHGSVELPSINKEQAIILAEMTKAFVRIEYKLKNLKV